jgi:clan AA aspartic protease
MEYPIINYQTRIPIKVFGFSKEFSIDIQSALIDTGFTGFLSLPLSCALSAGLILASTNDFILADGSTSTTLMCFGAVIFEEKTFSGLVSISPGKDVLIGMEFLSKLAYFNLDFKKQIFSLNL